MTPSAPDPSEPSEPLCHDAATLRFYADAAATYAAKARAGANRRLDGFLARLAPGARILELGCGDGRDSEVMLARGFDIDPTDGSEAMARQAQARLDRAVRVMRFDALDVGGAYDGVWASASLLHAPRAVLPDILARIYRALKPGGVHFATYKTGEAEGRDGLGRYFNYLSAEEVEAAYRCAGWEILDVEAYDGGDYEGGRRPWIAITVRKSH